MEWLFALDHTLFYAVNHLPHPAALDTAAYIIHRATLGGVIYYPLLHFFALQKSARARLLAKLGVLGGIVNYAVTDLMLKNLFLRARPCEAALDAICLPPAPFSYSFPSGQSAAAFLAATLIMLCYPERRRATWAAFGFALLVALDRVYMGHHYPLDVIVGALSGAGVAWLVFRLDRSPSKEL